MFEPQRSSTSRRATGAAIAVLALVSLAGCSLIETPPPAPLTGTAACAQGKTWNLDMANLAEVLQAELATRAIVGTVVADGSQSLAWSLEGKVDLTADYTVTVTTGEAEAQVVVTDAHSGVSKGIAYTNAEVAIPRDWDASGLDHTTTATVGGVAAETAPFTLPNLDIDDSVGVELTCDGGTMTTHQRGSDITLTWTS